MHDKEIWRGSLELTAVPLYSITGASGTGKTTVLSEVVRLRPNWIIRSEYTRTLVPILGYRTPWEMIDECGIAFYEAIMIASWSSLVELGTSYTVVLDRSPLDNYCYFSSLKSRCDGRYERPLLNLARHYAQMIKHYFLIPCGRFPFQPDAMRQVDIQIQYQTQLVDIFRTEKIDYSIVQSSSVRARAEEIIKGIETYI